jgi:hypothetical protein
MNLTHIENALKELHTWKLDKVLSKSIDELEELFSTDEIKISFIKCKKSGVILKVKALQKQNIIVFEIGNDFLKKMNHRSFDNDFKLFYIHEKVHLFQESFPIFNEEEAKQFFLTEEELNHAVKQEIKACAIESFYADKFHVFNDIKKYYLETYNNDSLDGKLYRAKEYFEEPSICISGKQILSMFDRCYKKENR